MRFSGACSTRVAEGALRPVTMGPLFEVKSKGAQHWLVMEREQDRFVLRRRVSVAMPTPERHDETVALFPFEGPAVDLGRAAAAEDVVDARAAVTMALRLLARSEHLDAAEQGREGWAAGQRVDIIQSDAIVGIGDFLGKSLQGRVSVRPAVV